MGYANGNQTSHWRCNVRTSVSYPNNTQATVNVQCIFQSCGWAHAINLRTCRVSCNGANSEKSSKVDNRSHGSGNWSETVVHSNSWTVNRNSGWNCGSSAYINNVSGYENGSSSASCSDWISGIPATKPPVPTNVKLTRNSDSELTATWTHGGSGLSAEKKTFVDGEVNQSGNWTNIYNNTKTTSYRWTGRSPNSCYRVRIGAENDAGNAGDHGYSNYVYTTPAAAKSISNAVAVINSGSQELSFNIDKGNTKYPSTKVDFQYSNDNSTWRGSGGTSGAVYSVNTTGAISLSAGSMDNTLKTYINNMKNGGKLYIRARVWNADNSLASGWTGSLGVAFSEQSRVYIWVPDGTNVNNVRVYVNKP